MGRETVFTVTANVYQEGGYLLGVAATLDGAQRMALDDLDDDDASDSSTLRWEQSTFPPPITGCRAAWAADHPDDDHWRYYQIIEITVTGQ